VPLGFEAVLIPRRSFFISDFPFVPCVRKEKVKPPAKPYRYHPLPQRLELLGLRGSLRLIGITSLPSRTAPAMN